MDFDKTMSHAKDGKGHLLIASSVFPGPAPDFSLNLLVGMFHILPP